MNKDSKVLKSRFTSLLVNMQLYLQDNSNCEILRMCVLSMDHVKVAVKDSKLDQELDSAQTTGRIISTLVKKDLLSFLHYDFIEEIVTSCCVQSCVLKDLLEKYEEAYNEYIKRRVCETSLYNEGQFKEFTGSDSEKKTVELLLITDEKWNGYTPFARVKDFEYIIQTAFRCNKFLLTLKSIEPQCLKLRYALIPSLVDHIFPLTLEEWNKLRSHGVAQIHCRDYHYMVDRKCKFHMIHGLMLY